MNKNLLSFLPKMYFPGSIFIGDKSLNYFDAMAEEKKLLVVSESFLSFNHDELFERLKVNFDSIKHSGEPTFEDLNNLKKKCIKGKYKYIIAVGGGSVIDLCKAAKMETNIKMIAVPTVIGSGSEVSQYSLLLEEGIKKIITSSDLLPEIVLLIPHYLKSLSREKIIFQATDALAHGLESLVSRISNPFSDVLALTAIEDIYKFLPRVDDRENDVFLEKLQIAGVLAGLAQSSSATGLAHSLAHYFGASCDIPHAEAVSVFLIDVLKLNKQHTDKYQKLNALKSISADNFIEKFRRLFKDLDVKTTKVTLKNDIDVIAEDIRKDVCTLTNPYSPKKEDIIKIIEQHR